MYLKYKIKVTQVCVCKHEWMDEQTDGGKLICPPTLCRGGIKRERTTDPIVNVLVRKNGGPQKAGRYVEP